MKFIRYKNLILNPFNFTFKIEMCSIQPHTMFGVIAYSNNNKEIQYTLFANENVSECQKHLLDLAQELNSVQMDEESWQDIASK